MSKEINQNKWILTSEAAKYCRIAPNTLAIKVAKGIGPRCVYARRSRRRFTYEWLDEWLIFLAVDGNMTQWKKYLESHCANYEEFINVKNK